MFAVCPRSPSPRAIAAILILALAACGLGCGRDNTKKKEDEPTNHLTAPRAENGDRFENYTETGDLPQLKKRGVIRFVTLAASDDNLLPRMALVTQLHRELAEDLARRLKLESRWIAAATPTEALQMLNDGRADVLAGNLTRTDAREKEFLLSEVIRTSRQQLIAGKNGPAIDNPDELKNVVIDVVNGSTFEVTAQALQKNNHNIELLQRKLRPGDTIDALIDTLNRKTNMVTILDSSAVKGLQGYRDDFKVGAYVSDDEDIVWAMRKSSPELKLRINNFLTKHKVKALTQRDSDWASIKKSGFIRFLTYNGPTSYFMWKGVLMGFDYDLAMKFAEKHKLELQLVVVPYHESLNDWLKVGRGDFAGASTTITTARMEQGVSFTAPYIEIPEQVLSNNKGAPIESIADLNGRTLTLRAYSAFIETAKTLQRSGIDVTIETAKPDVSYEQIINMVADGDVDVTIVDATAAEIGASLRKELIAGPLLSDPLPQGWMVVAGNDSLRKKLDRFITGFRNSDNYAKKVDTYFKPNKSIGEKLAGKLQPGKDLSPYDKLVKHAARKHEFDWRMIVAQMWQESSFNPKAESPVGAQGLLQVMPRTAEEVGFPPPLFEPERGIAAGVKYMEWIRDRFEPGISLENRLWFSLAAYNAGIGHLYDAQRLASELGLDPDIWFDNVEVAMLKLSEPRYFEKARYGYVRGAEPVHYVRNISKLYQAYTEIAPGEVADSRSTVPKNGVTPSSVQSCRYGHLIPSADAPPRPQRVEMSPQSAGGSCPRQSVARWFPQGPGQSLPSLPVAAGAGWNRSRSGVSALPATY